MGMTIRYTESPLPAYFKNKVGKKCEACGGSGTKPATSSGGTVKCQECRGTGRRISK